MGGVVKSAVKKVKTSVRGTVRTAKGLLGGGQSPEDAYDATKEKLDAEKEIAEEKLRLRNLEQKRIQAVAEGTKNKRRGAFLSSTFTSDPEEILRASRTRLGSL